MTTQSPDENNEKQSDKKEEKHKQAEDKEPAHTLPQIGSIEDDEKENTVD